MKTVVQPYDEEVDVTVLEVDMPEPELLEQKTGSPEVTPATRNSRWSNGWVESCRNICRRNLRKRSIR